MDSLVSPVIDLTRLLQDAYKIYLNNAKLMIFLVLLSMSFYSLLYLTDFFSTRALISDLLLKQSLLLLTSPSAPEFASPVVGMINDLRIFAGVEWLFMFVSSIASFLFAVATICASATTNGSREVSVSNLLRTTLRSWKAFVTASYITLFNLGYVFFCLVALLPFLLPGFSALGVAVSVLAGAFYCYLAVVWNLSLVISVLEEHCYGIEALGKAAQLVRGAEFVGFLLNLVLVVISWAMFEARWKLTVISPSSRVFQALAGLLLLNGFLLLQMLGHTAYTVLYLDSKQRAGEVADLPGSDVNVEYTKVSSQPPLIGQGLP